MSNENQKDLIDAAEAAIFSLDIAKGNIERYLSLHGLTRTPQGVIGRAAEFKMGGAEARAQFDSVICQSVELAVKNLEEFISKRSE